MNMPGTSGAELLQIVRARWPQITPVLMTGYAAQADQLPVGGLVLAKPFSAADLSRVLQRDAAGAGQVNREDGRGASTA